MRRTGGNVPALRCASQLRRKIMHDPAAPESAVDPSRHWLRHLLRWLVPLVFLGIVGGLLWHEVDAIDLPQMQRSLLQVPTAAIILIGLLALFGVAFTGLIDWAIARWLAIGLPLRELLPLSFVANSISNTVNLSGAVGSGVRLLGLNARKVALPRSAALIGLQVLSLPLGLSVLILMSLAVGSLPMTPGTTTQWLAIVVLIGAAAYLPLFFVLTARRRLMGWLPKGQALPPVTLKLQLALLSFVDWLLAASVLYACLYVSGVSVKPGPLVGTFAAASVLGLASMVPAGLGVFDGLMLLALVASGHDQGSVLSGLFLFRLGYYLLPLLVGLGMGSGMVGRRLPAFNKASALLRSHPVFGVLGLPANLLAGVGVRLLAALTFLAGVLLLASAAIPTVHERIEQVSSVLPLAAVEGSSWLSVLAGVLLLGLGRGIDGRLHVAYRLTQPLLLLGAALAVLKGLHYGEAVFLIGLFVLLRVRKREFTQRAMSLTSAATFGWLLGLLAVVIAFFAAGLTSILGDDSFDLFYFGFGEHSSRVARAFVAALLGIVIYLIWQTLSVKRPPLKLPDRSELERAREIYRNHGGGEFGQLSFMRDKPLFWSSDHQVVVAYGAVRDRLVALGSPCGPEKLIRRAVRDFREFADSQDRVPVFYEVLEPELSLYHDMGFDLFKLGELALIPLAEFTLQGKRWEDLRQAVNRSTKERLSFELLQPPFDTALVAEVEAVSDAWLADKGASEKGFSLGRFDHDYLEWGPLAIVRRDDAVIAFANVIPPYGGNRIASVDLMRHLDDAPRGTMDFLFARVMHWAQEQGCEQFSLGMAPLSSVGDNPYARINERLAALAFQYGGKLYNYQGLRRYKDKFGPTWVGAYLAYPRRAWVPGLLLDIAALVAGGYRRLLFNRR